MKKDMKELYRGLDQWAGLLEAIKRGLTAIVRGNSDFSAAEPQKELPAMWIAPLRKAIRYVLSVPDSGL